MKCLSCNFDNPDSGKFCGACGKPLDLACLSCGASNPADFRFCSQCGATLANRAPPARSSPVAPAPRREAVGHRQLTVMFCDLADSTALSRQLDTEDYSEVIRAYRVICAEAVERHGGSVTRYLGDGLLVAFGYPRAHEDDARRAARAALEIAGRVRAIDARPLGLSQPLGVRIGINTGPVMAGDIEAGGALEYDGLLGETLNVAARLQGLASLDTVVVSEATRLLVEASFELEPLGPQTLKGIDVDLHVYRLIREKTEPDRRARVSVVPIVGRAEELEIAAGRWRRAEHGTAQYILVSGEAGIGKSRLIDEIEVMVSGKGGTALHASCSAYTSTSTLNPFVELVLHHCGIAPGDDAAARWRKLAAAMTLVGVAATDLERLALLLDLPPRDAGLWQDLSPNRRRQETFDGLMHWLQATAARRPLLLVVEDLHWADDSTLDLLEALFLRLRSARLLVICSARSEFRLGWPAHPARIDLTLDRLSDDEVRTLMASLHLHGRLSDAAIDAISRRADGIPLFVNELARSMEGTAGSRNASSVPVSLRDLLRARIDGLACGRSLIQYAAAFGQLFTVAGLATVLGMPAHEIGQDVDYLIRQGFIEDAGSGGELRFHHALLRDEVYETTMRQDRRRLHAEIADAIARAMPDVLERQPEVLATHLAQAGRVAEAIENWQRAGRRASERSANDEAVQHYRNALALLPSLPADAGRDQLELALHVALGGQLIATRGNAAPEVEEAYSAAERLCRSVQDTRLLFRALRGLQTFAMVRGRLRSATEIGGRLIDIARDDGDPGMLMQAHRPMGLNLLYNGRYDEACAELAEALGLYDAERHRSHRFEYGSDPAVLARCNLGWAHWLAGRPVTGLAEAEEAVAEARRIGHPHSLAFALSFLSSVQQCRGDVEATLAASTELATLAKEHVFPYWASWADALGGWAEGQSGAYGGGARRIAAALESYRQTGAELMRPYFLGLLADIHLGTNMAPAAAVDLAEAVDRARSMSIDFYLPELLRLLALASRAAGQADEQTLGHLVEATRCAEAQNSGSWRLRCLQARSALRVRDGGIAAELDSLAGSFPELRQTAEFRQLSGDLR
jgi:class 3 adenylate cyclase